MHKNYYSGEVETTFSVFGIERKRFYISTCIYWYTVMYSDARKRCFCGFSVALLVILYKVRVKIQQLHLISVSKYAID